jgi:hypothetical protein
MKNINCIHCLLQCKVKGKTECDSYISKASRPEQLKLEIKEAFSAGDYNKAKDLQNELFRHYHG